MIIQRLKPRVLVAEDSLLLADALSDLLLDWGYEPVGPASSSSKALALLAQDSFDVALVDINLRDGSTFELGSRFVRQNVPFLFLTGARLQALPADLRSVPLVLKPFDVGSLQAQLQALLSKVDGPVAASNKPNWCPNWISNLAEVAGEVTSPKV